MRFFNKKLNNDIEPSVSETKPTSKKKLELRISTRKILLNKNNGNITSFIYGLAFLTLLAVWMLFSYRLILINAMFDFIDDSLTSSTLAMAVIDIDEYGRSNQLIIHDIDEYDTTSYSSDTTYGDATKGEAGILLSYLNKNSSILSTIDTLPLKEVTCFSNDAATIKSDYHTTGSANTGRASFLLDEHMLNSINLGVNSLTSNITNLASVEKFAATTLGTPLNSVNTKYQAKGTTTSGNNSQSFGTVGNLALSYSDILNNSFLKNFVVSDMEISNISIYNVYRAELAELKTYQYDENWFNVTYTDNTKKTGKITAVTPKSVTPGAHSETMNASGNATSAAVTLSTLEDFDKVYKPAAQIWVATTDTSVPLDDTGAVDTEKIIEYYPNKTSATKYKIENSSYGTEYQTYVINRNQFEKQLNFYNTAKGLTGGAATNSNCFINTHTTNQKKVNDSEYQYAFSTGTTLLDIDINTLQKKYGTIKDATTLTGKAPIVAVGVFRYQQPTDSTYVNYNSAVQSYDYVTLTGETKTSEYAEIVADDTTAFTNDIKSYKLKNCKSAGKELTDTAVYMELTFSISTYPTMPGVVQSLQNNYKTVTVSRLIDITLNE